ncbi:hypothetical protein HK104_010836 [Borealophlyctis nickersoniae]|nr:hypothetical protein HK104_010836 [Borealophlyctis nickersoniae]
MAAKGERFAVSVKRVDELVDVDESETKGKLVAARVVDVIVLFEVSPSGEVSVNSVPVPLGVSTIKTEAGMVMGVSADANMTKEELKEAFDVGIVAIEVHAKADRIAWDDGMEVTRLVIAERILEINGAQMEQNDIMQQVMILKEDGTVIRSMPCAVSAADADGILQPHGCWRRLRAHASAIMMSIIFLGGICAIAISRLCMTVVYGSDDMDDSATFLDRVQFYDVYEPVSTGKAEEEDKLPAYTSNGYAAVETDEKKEEEL